MPDDIQDIVRCRNFELVDENGMRRVHISVDQGDVILALCDANGAYRIHLDLDSDGDAGIFISNPSGDHVDLGIDSASKPYFEKTKPWRKD